MKKYRFKGDPGNYRWSFPLEVDGVYDGNLEPIRRHSIEELMEASRKEGDSYFLSDWEEVGDGV